MSLLRFLLSADKQYKMADPDVMIDTDGTELTVQIPRKLLNKLPQRGTGFTNTVILILQIFTILNLSIF